jgi:hypothetical protein
MSEEEEEEEKKPQQTQQKVDPRAAKELETSLHTERQSAASVGSTFPGRQDSGRAPRGFVNAASLPLPTPSSSRKRDREGRHHGRVDPLSVTLSPGMFDPEVLAQQARSTKRQRQ